MKVLISTCSDWFDNKLTLEVNSIDEALNLIKSGEITMPMKEGISWYEKSSDVEEFIIDLKPDDSFYDVEITLYDFYCE